MPSVKLIVDSAEMCVCVYARVYVCVCVFYIQKVRLVMFYASYFLTNQVKDNLSLRCYVNICA